MLRQGLGQSEVARAVGVHRQSVSRWARELGESGMRGLRKAGRSGRPSKLSPVQLRDLERALKRGPEAFGYASGLWTAARVRDLIADRTGVRYHEDHVWRILRKAFGLPEDARLSRLGSSVNGRATSPAKVAKIEWHI